MSNTERAFDEMREMREKAELAQKVSEKRIREIVRDEIKNALTPPPADKEREVFIDEVFRKHIASYAKIFNPEGTGGDHD